VPPEDIFLQSTLAVNCLGLDFGAVDIIYNQKKDVSFVLEVNTAPGLEGSTLNEYVKEFNNALPNL